MINQIVIKEIDSCINRDVRNRTQVSLHTYVCTGYKIYNINDSRLKKTKAYKIYMGIKREIYNSSVTVKNIIRNTIDLEIMRMLNEYKGIKR